MGSMLYQGDEPMPCLFDLFDLAAIQGTVSLRHVVWESLSRLARQGCWEPYLALGQIY